MALDCRSPIDFGPSASSPFVRPSVHYDDDDDDAVLLSFISGRSRPSVRVRPMLGARERLWIGRHFRVPLVIPLFPSLPISPF